MLLLIITSSFGATSNLSELYIRCVQRSDLLFKQMAHYLTLRSEVH